MGDFNKTGSFVAFDATGKRYVVGIYTEVTHYRGSRTDLSVTTDMALEDGSARGVNRLEKGRYVIRDSDIELTSTDPAAP
jgi:hypothetical protein